jgi:predicted HicB family RNase H-like nuclease
MADKTQNIFVNYKFNTADVERAQQPLNKVNQLNNQIQQSAGKAGSAITQEFQKSQKTILDMNNALTRLRSVIEVTSNPQKLKQLSGEYQNIKRQLDAATKSAFGFNTALKEQGSLATQAAGKFGQLYGAVQTVVGAAIVKQVASFTIEMARLQGNTEGVQRAFERAFPNSFQILQDLRQATRGTVTDFELMQRTLQATNLGLSVEQLPELFEFAAVRAQQTGESVDYLVDSIVRGIGRKSPLILDNLGISAIRLKEKFNGAALASQSVADVTKAVAEIAAEEMSKMGGHVDTAATKVDQMNVAWTNLRTNLAKAIDSSSIINFFTEAFNGMARALKGQKEIEKESTKQRAATEFQSLREHQLADQRLKDGRLQKQTQQELINQTQNEIRERMKLIEQGRVDLLILKQKFDAASHTRNGTAKEINDNIKIREQISFQGSNLARNIKFYEETIKLLRQYSDGLDDVAQKQLTTISTLREQLKGLQEQREEATSIDNKPELDRLQREILLLEDRILKISDNIKWQKQWNREKEEQALSAMNAAAAEEELGKSIDFVSNKLGTAADKAPEFKDSLDEIEEALKETTDAIDLSTGKEFFIRLRLGIKGEGGETSEIQKFVNDQMAKLGETIYNGTLDNLHSIVDAEVDSYRQRIEATEAFYDNQIALAGDNERAKDVLRIREKRETDKLRSEMARKEKQAKRTHVLIDVAAGIAKALATYAWPYSLIPAAIVAAQGAAQLAIINRQPTNFAKGVIDLKGPGTSTSDSIPANLSRGESVMTAWETKHAGDALRDIRAKKLDNNKLRQLKQGRDPVPSQALGTAEIVKAIKDQKHPDVVKTSNLIYESKRYNDEYRKRVRSASVKI